MKIKICRRNESVSICFCKCACPKVPSRHFSALKDRCRVCLGVSENVVNIFEAKQDLLVSIAQVISECTDCDIKEGDDLSELICASCLEDAQSAFDIIRKYERSYITFCEAYEAVLEEDSLDGEGYTISDSESGTSSHDTNGNQKYINADEIYEISEDECDQTVDAKGEDFNNSVDDSVHSKNQQHDEKEPKESGTLDKDVQDAPRNESVAPDHQQGETDTEKLALDGSECVRSGARMAYKCSHCSKSFPHRSRFEEHNRVHTGERPFKCPSCPMTFRLKSFLKRHSALHLEERPYPCDICAKTFADKSNLRQHKKTHSDIRPFDCPSCLSSFRLKSHLDRHTMSHTGERPFKCDHCGKDFTLRCNLVKHLRTHTRERPFKCSI